MAKQTDTFQTIGFQNAATLFQNGDGTSAKDIIAAGSNDSIITALAITNSDSAASVVTLILNDGSTDFVVSALTIPARAGTNGSIVPVDGLDAPWLPLSSGKRVLTLETGWKLRAALVAATNGDVTVTAFGQDY